MRPGPTGKPRPVRQAPRWRCIHAAAAVTDHIGTFYSTSTNLQRSMYARVEHLPGATSVPSTPREGQWRVPQTIVHSRPSSAHHLAVAGKRLHAMMCSTVHPRSGSDHAQHEPLPVCTPRRSLMDSKVIGKAQSTEPRACNPTSKLLTSRYLLVQNHDTDPTLCTILDPFATFSSKNSAWRGS